ncbi:hypothetical protein OHT59_29910 [Streptomyces sp. NBC_00243]|uniref:hypothetical protein n=1 Tax=Streptomyces sp. NBC_00243 TaxID=2975688 RepID=UPI002DDB6159|nr:hypothetical protein [Streptomyces sp. NBC_00243]WRZ26236.1 hypothetical protein OHT59_29910 [Streptomyces sp. NBC_00243]
MSIAVLAPLLSYGIGRWLPVPLVIFEIVLGVLVGPDVLGRPCTAAGSSPSVSSHSCRP